MANNGLKHYTKQLTQQVGSVAEVNVNINSTDANLIASMPLLTTVGLAPIELGLIFNYQNRNVTSPFGSGVRLNLFSKLTYSSSFYRFNNSDGSTDLYNENILNKNTNSTFKTRTYSSGSGTGSGNVGIVGPGGGVSTTTTAYLLYDKYNNYKHF